MSNSRVIPYFYIFLIIHLFYCEYTYFFLNKNQNV